MYNIKQIAEDFRVDEISNVEASSGKYCYFWLEKKNYTTFDALKKVGEALYVRRFGFAGSKDKKAITRQLCSGEIKKETLEKLRLKDIEVKFFGYGDKPISLGDLKGNAFEIVVRNLERIEIPDKIKVVNYFDEQRFSKTNVKVGRAIVKGDLKSAVELIAQGSGDYNLDVESYSKENPTDFVGAMGRIPKKILSIFVHSYQSWLWNEIAARYVKHGKKVDYSLGKFIFAEVPNVKIPIIGFGTEFSSDVKDIALDLMEKEGIGLRDFIIRKIPELSAEGVERDLIVDVDVKHEASEDELNAGMRKVKLSFTLPKGSYATIVVKALF